MESEIVRGIGLIVVLGVGLQWAASKLPVPSIVLLLAGGLVVGPWLDLVDPDEIFGDALFPVVSLAVGLLLFNGAMELRLSDLRGVARSPVLRLVTVGALGTWLLGAAAVHVLFGESVRISLLLGAILVVSGPTVVGPLLRLARPTDPTSTILRWEGIVIDPLGATLGLFCVNAFFVSELTLGEVWSDLVVVALAGVAAGLAAAALLVVALRRLLVPDELEVTVALMLVVAAYVVAEGVRSEAGLFATTAMGLALANQRIVPVRQLRVFGQPIVVLLIGTLFIVLASRVEADPLIEYLPESLALAAFLALVVRPLVVAVSTLRHPSLPGRARAFLACLAPRGIVAAATASLFTLRLEDIDSASQILVPATFAVIVALALVYGLGVAPVARMLGVARPRPRGAMVVSGEPWAIGLAAELCHQGVPAILVARGRADLAARAELPFRVHTGLIRELPGSGLLDDVSGAVIASRDDETDLMALGVLVGHLGRRQVWMLPGDAPAGGAPTREDEALEAVESWAQRPFAPEATHARLEAAGAAGWQARTVPAAEVPADALALVALTADGGWTAAVDAPRSPADRVIVLG